MVLHIDAEANASPVRILDSDALTERVPLHPSTIWRMEAAGRFPKRIRLGTRAVGWLEHEVNAWIAERARGCAKPPETLKRTKSAQ
jgi:prophage regulatory protein